MRESQRKYFLDEILDPYGLTQYVKGYTHAGDVYSRSYIEKYIKKNTKKLDELNEAFKMKVIELLRGAWQAGLLVDVYSGFRSFDSQLNLYTKWKKGESKYPTAIPGNSYHNYGLAVDLRVLDYEEDGGKMPLGIDKLGLINKDQGIGLTWGRAFGDDPHFADMEHPIKYWQIRHPLYEEWMDAHPEIKAELGQVDTIQDEIKETSRGDSWWKRNIGWIVPAVTIPFAIVVLYLVVNHFREEE